MLALVTWFPPFITAFLRPIINGVRLYLTYSTSISLFIIIELSFGRPGTLFLVTSADFRVFAETTIVFEQYIEREYL